MTMQEPTEITNEDLESLGKKDPLRRDFIKNVLIPEGKYRLKDEKPKGAGN